MGRKKKHICTHKSVKKDDIEVHVMNAVISLLNDEYAIDKILEMAEYYQRNDTERLNDIKEAERRLNDVNTKISNILTAIEAGIFTPATKQRLQELENIKQQLDYELICKRASATKFSKATLKKLLKNLSLTEAASKPEKQALVDQLINRIYLWEDKILIIFNFSGIIGEDPSIADADINAVLKRISEPSLTGSDINEYGEPSEIRTPDNLIKRSVWYAVYVAVAAQNSVKASVSDCFQYISIIFIGINYHTTTTLI